MSQGDKGTTFERLVNLVALIIGITALFFSCQANRIAKEANESASRQVDAQLVILEASYNDAYYESLESGDEGRSACRHKILLTNLGGATTALVGYNVEISYQGKIIEFDGSDASIRNQEKIIPWISDFRVTFLSADTPSGSFYYNNYDNKQYWLPLPFQIDGFTTLWINANIEFHTEKPVSLGDLVWPGRNDPKSYDYNPESLEGYSPIKAVYKLKTASGQVATSPPIPCWYIK